MWLACVCGTVGKLCRSLALKTVTVERFHCKLNDHCLVRLFLCILFVLVFYIDWLSLFVYTGYLALKPSVCVGF